MKEITVQELVALRNRKEAHQLIDVREPWEYKRVQLGGELLPMGDLHKIASHIKKDKDTKVIIHCYRGSRSAKVIHALETAYGFEHLYNLKGGVEAYIKQIDPSLPSY